ncbi:MAG: bifunctional tetrahydrofolate synthase/dihydrofolate synthase [Thiotrichaceae bacterium]
MNSKNPRFDSLDEWLKWQESVHWVDIDLGLDRIREVATRMQLLSVPFPIITVAGTNGKGSTVAILEAMLIAEGYRTGSYTSPYLYRYNERIKVSNNGVAKDTEDALLCAAFAAIDSARAASATAEEISLTYFEFATLAAIWIFHQQDIEVAILEVGMGGRLDAVNLWDNDVAVITSIGIDHVKWLGDNREDIGREKSGIMRQGGVVISGDLEPPLSIAEQAREIGAILYQAANQDQVNNQLGKGRTGKNFSCEFTWEIGETDWNLRLSEQQWVNLPFPALQGDFQFNNAAVAISALYALKNKLKVSNTSIRAGLKQVKLLGRLEQVQTQPDIILDVAHNGHAAKQLAGWLSKTATQRAIQRARHNNKSTQKNEPGKTYALFSMLDDKDINQVVDVMNPLIDRWFVSTLNDPRGISVEDLVNKMSTSDVVDATDINITAFETLEAAWEGCKKELKKADKVIVFGSFLVLSQFKVIF